MFIYGESQLIKLLPKILNEKFGKGLLQFNSKILETVILFLSTKRKYMEMRKNSRKR